MFRGAIAQTRACWQKKLRAKTQQQQKTRYQQPASSSRQVSRGHSSFLFTACCCSVRQSQATCHTHTLTTHRGGFYPRQHERGWDRVAAGPRLVCVSLPTSCRHARTHQGNMTTWHCVCVGKREQAGEGSWSFPESPRRGVWRGGEAGTVGRRVARSERGGRLVSDVTWNARATDLGHCVLARERVGSRS